MGKRSFVLTAVFSSLGVVIACGGSKTSTSACDSVFDTLYAKCSQSTQPAAEMARLRTRYEQVCEHALTLPGTRWTSQRLSACAAAVAAQGCRDLGTLAMCRTPGTLAGGARCTDGLQCQSNTCSRTAAMSADGGLVTLACGVCEMLIADGQPCAFAQGQCGPQSRCDSTVTPPTCVAVIAGDLGSSCGNATCKAGLFCDSTQGQCAMQAGTGTACASSNACVSPLVCLGTGANRTCQNPQTSGGACIADADCAPGLGCTPLTRQCGTIAWASSGQPCGGLVHCLVGSCPGPSLGGICPVVIADNQPCDAPGGTTCDTFASCTNGTCALTDSAACN